jgi:hypothetical protein
MRLSKILIAFASLVFSAPSGNFLVHSYWSDGHAAPPFGYVSADSLGVTNPPDIGIAGTNGSGAIIPSIVLEGDTSTYSVTQLQGSNQDSGYNAAIFGESNRGPKSYAFFIEGQDNDGSGSNIDAAHVEGIGNFLALGSNIEATHIEGGTNGVGGGSDIEYAHIEGESNQFGILDNFGATHLEGETIRIGDTVDGANDHFEGESNSVNHGTTIGSSHIEGNDNIIGENGSYNSIHVEGESNIIDSGVSAYAFHIEGLDNYVGTIGDGIFHLEGEDNRIDPGAECAGCHIEGETNVAFSLAYCAHAEGNDNQISGSYNHVENQGNTLDSTSQTSHAEGSYNRVLGGSGNHVEGGLNQSGALGANYNHSEGYGTAAFSLAAHSEGEYTIAEAQAAHAEGIGSVAAGADSHAETGGTTYGLGSHAESFSRANGDYSHCEGVENTCHFGQFIGGRYAADLGENDTAPTPGQTIFGLGWGNSGIHNTVFRIIDSGSIYQNFRSAPFLKTNSNGEIVPATAPTFADSSRASHIADTAKKVGFADSSRASHIADTAKKVGFADSSRASHIADSAKTVQLHKIDSMITFQSGVALPYRTINSHRDTVRATDAILAHTGSLVDTIVFLPTTPGRMINIVRADNGTSSILLSANINGVTTWSVVTAWGYINLIALTATTFITIGHN